MILASQKMRLWINDVFCTKKQLKHINSMLTGITRG